MRHSFLFAILAGATVTLAPLGAQAPPSTGASRVCLRGRPLPDCSAFFITEFGVAKPLSTAGGEPGRLALWTLELGGMKNLAPQAALGATGLFEASGLGGSGRFGFGPRFRYWVGPELPVDLSAGVTTRGWYGRAGMSAGDLLGVSLQFERYQDPGSSWQSDGWFLGARLGARPGLVVLALLSVLLMASTSR